MPRFLQRYRLPAAVTSVALGAVAGMGFGLFQNDATIQILSTFGIVSLFLFAGLEVDFAGLRKEAPVLLQHLVIRGILLAAATWVAQRVLSLELRPACLVALALFTPSAGFILDSLAALGLTDRERFWIQSKAGSPPSSGILPQMSCLCYRGPSLPPRAPTATPSSQHDPPFAA